METGTLDATFAALADPTRRAILARLASGEASVMELSDRSGRPPVRPMPMGLPYRTFGLLIFLSRSR